MADDTESFGSEIDLSDEVNSDHDPRQRTPVREFEFDSDILKKYKGDFVATALLKHVQIQVGVKVRNAKNGKKVRDFTYHDSLVEIERVLGISKSALQRAALKLSAAEGHLTVKKLKGHDNMCSYALRNQAEFLASRAAEDEYTKLKCERYKKEAHKLNWVEGCVLYNLTFWQGEINGAPHPDCLYDGKYWFYKKTCKICAGHLTTRQKKEALFSLETKGLIERVPYYDGGGLGKGKWVKDQWWIHVNTHFARVNKVNPKNHVCWTKEHQKRHAERLKRIAHTFQCETVTGRTENGDIGSSTKMGNPRTRMGNPRTGLGNPSTKVGNRNPAQTTGSENIAKDSSNAAQSSVYASSLSVPVAPLPAHQKNLDSNLPLAGATDGDRAAPSPSASPSWQPHSRSPQEDSLTLVKNRHQRSRNENEAEQPASTKNLPGSSQGGGATKANKKTASVIQTRDKGQSAAGARQSKQSKQARSSYQANRPQPLTLVEVDQIPIPSLQETQIQQARRESDAQRETEAVKINQEQARQRNRYMVNGRPTGRTTGQAVDRNGRPVPCNASRGNDLPEKQEARRSEPSSSPIMVRVRSHNTAYAEEMATDRQNVRLRYQEAYRAVFPDEEPDRLGQADEVYASAQQLRIPVRVFSSIAMSSWAFGHPGRKYHSTYLVGDAAFHAVAGWLDAARNEFASTDESSVAMLMKKYQNKKIDWRHRPTGRDASLAAYVRAVEKVAQRVFGSDCGLTEDDFRHVMDYAKERKDWNVMVREITEQLCDPQMHTVVQAIRALEGRPERKKETFNLHSRNTLCRKAKKARRRRKVDPANETAGEYLERTDREDLPLLA